MQVQDAVYELLDNAQGEIEVNKQAIRALLMKELGVADSLNIEKANLDADIERMISEYAESFTGMARLGFVSMDLDDDAVFHVIAYPKDQNVPDRIMKMLPEINEGDVRIENSNY